jgi:hypothetical protein
MPPAGIKSAIPAIERRQDYVLDRTANGIGPNPVMTLINIRFSIKSEKRADHLIGCQFSQKDSDLWNWL